MSRGRFLLTLHCTHCGEREQLTFSDILSRLRDLGFLRREGEPSEDLAAELAQSAIDSGRWGSCPACGRQGMGMTPAVDEADNADVWDDVRHCERCHGVIPSDRLEVFPDARRCAKCQNLLESGQDGNDHEYCPHCGSVMQLKAARAPGATYRMYCPSCRKTP